MADHYLGGLRHSSKARMHQDHPRRRPDDDGARGGALQGFLSSALAGILTLLFAWRILLELEESTEDDVAKTPPSVSPAALAIDQPVGVGGASAVAHGNNAATHVDRVRAAVGVPGNRSRLARAPVSDQTSIDSWPPPTDESRKRCGGSEPDLFSNEHRNSSPASDCVDSHEATPGGVIDSAEMSERAELLPSQFRPLWTGSSDDEATSSGDELNFVRDDDDRNHDDQHGDDPEPEMTSSTWMSLFRTFFMGGGAQIQTEQQRLAAERSRRLEDRNVDEYLLDRTLSTITEEGGDELSRKLDELDEEIENAERMAWYEGRIGSSSDDCTNYDTYSSSYSSEDNENNNVDCSDRAILHPVESGR